jgi:hypothetical protein
MVHLASVDKLKDQASRFDELGIRTTQASVSFKGLAIASVTIADWKNHVSFALHHRKVEP